MGTPPISRWLVAIAGFCQDVGENVGMSKLWRAWQAEHGGPNAVALFCEYSHDVAELAALIRQYRGGSDPDIVIAGYSWGGQTAANLCRELYPLPIRRLILSDAIYRSRWCAELAHLLGQRATLEVPSNVARVDWWRQTVGWPHGHEVVAEDPLLTRVAPCRTVLTVGHQGMDEVRDFHICAREAADE